MSAPQPIPGVPVRPPLVPPQAGQVITHYETYTPEVRQTTQPFLLM